jgi:serine/threonine protein kinase
MFMEYVVGGELFTHLRDAGRFHDTAARFYAAEVLLAIDYLHARNVVYRDLKVKPHTLSTLSHTHPVQPLSS